MKSFVFALSIALILVTILLAITTIIACNTYISGDFAQHFYLTQSRVFVGFVGISVAGLLIWAFVDTELQYRRNAK